MTSATAAVASVVSSVVENCEPSVTPKLVEPVDVLNSLWNGTTLLELSPTSNATQLAKTMSAPARKMARPFVHDST